MRRILSYICALMLLALFPAAVHFAGFLPVDTGMYIAEKYAGWNGVLQAWVCCDWNPGGSWISWLNRCAAAFEKDHEGVYIEFTPVSRQVLAAMEDSGMRLPELVLFSPGALADAHLLAEVEIPQRLRSDLRLSSRAIPVAMGAGVWAVNPEGEGGWVCSPDSAAFLPGLLSGGDGEEPPAPEAPGLDLGLPAFAGGDGVEICEDALDRFMGGEASRIAVGAGELARLSRLRNEGKGPDWQLQACGEFACTDQLLYIGVTRGDEAPRSLAREFIVHLLAAESQAALAGIGACSAAGEGVHPAHAPQAEMEALLLSRPLAVCPPFSEHSPEKAAAIVRSLQQGICTPRQAAAKMGLEFSLPNYPN